jgi:hypothetical protein
MNQSLYIYIHISRQLNQEHNLADEDLCTKLHSSKTAGFDVPSGQSTIDTDPK